MNLLDHLQALSGILGAAGIDAALIGGIALGAHGVQRFTNDIDFLVDEGERLALRQALLARGWSIFAETLELMQFVGDIGIDVLFARRPISQALLKDAKLDPRLGLKIVSAEGLIGLKIQAYCNDARRELHDKADIAALIAKNTHLDWGIIKQYADLFEQWPVIAQLRSIHQSTLSTHKDDDDV